MGVQEQPKADTKPEATDTKADAKPQDMETEPNGVAPETTAEPVVEDPMEQ